MTTQNNHQPYGNRTVSRLVLCGFLAIAAFYLLTEHTAHVFGALPYLLLLACPVMHLFMHHGHGDHKRTSAHDDPHENPAEGGN